ncbi:MAG: nucleotidyltransferase family protein [Deltaproteobacteria bacterium]|nr:nucleotidyltransferase family protein [Deltaproteobacteria bacterium]
MKKDPKPKVAGLILAAGASIRMGRPKQLLPIGTGTLLDTVINEAVKSELDLVIVILGCRSEEIRKSLNTCLNSQKLTVIENTDWENGISSSLITGISYIHNVYDHCMVILADMPNISSGLINHLLYHYLNSGLKLGAITVGRKRSHPVIFNRSFYSEIYGLKGDIGAKRLFEKYSDKVCLVRPEQGYDDTDLDTPDDYFKYRNLMLEDKRFEDEEITRLFLSTLNHPGKNNADVKKVFSSLVKTTLNYRDHLLRNEGVTVTVSDVRTALDCLIPALATGRLPEKIDNISLNLLKIWIDEFKIMGKNH